MITQPVHSLLDLAARTMPHRLAATLGEARLSFGEVAARTTRMAHVLSGLGLGRGDRLVVQAQFTLDQLALYFAAQRLGAVFAPLNPAHRLDEVAPAIAYLRPALIVQDAACAQACPVRSAAPLAILGPEAAARGLHLDPLADAAPDQPLPAADIGPEDPHAIFLTSGSTGQPKGVVLSHRASWLRSLLGASRSVACGGRGELLTFPMFHWAGWNYLMENWAYKRPVHFLDANSGDAIARAIARHDPALFYAIPALWERLLDSRVPFDGRRLRAVGSGTSKFDAGLMARIAARFPNARRGVFYGSTEFGGACCLEEDEIGLHPGSVGLPYAGIEARIRDGELQLRGPTVMSGYFELPDKTAEVFDGDWYRTGDLVEMDGEGFVTITGRAREIIRSGGETVAPAEVELALRGFPGLRGVAVVGLEDPVWGEIVCAVTELEPGAACPEIGTLRAWLDGRIAAYKQPRRIVALPELPRTPATGQIMRTRIRALVETGMR